MTRFDDLLADFDIVYRGKWGILAVVAVGMVCIAAYLYFVDDVYRAEAVIMPLKGMEYERLEGLMGDSVQATYYSFTSSKIRAVLTSRRFNVQVVGHYDLLPILFREHWDAGKGRWRATPDKCGAPRSGLGKILGMRKDFSECPPSSLDGAKKLLGKLQLRNDVNNRLTVRFDDKDPEFAVAMVNRYLNDLDKYLRAETLARAMDNQRYLGALISAQTNSEIKRNLRGLLMRQIELEMYTKAKSTFLFEIVDPPLLPECPVKPGRIKVAVVGLSLFFMLGVVLVYSLEYGKRAAAVGRPSSATHEES